MGKSRKKYIKQIEMDVQAGNWKNLSYSQKLDWQKFTPEDCSFIIGDEVNAKTIGAHKAILAIASETFNSMFNGNYKESDASFNIPLPNVVDFMDFKVMLEYIYFAKTDFIELLNLERLKHVTYLADYYILDELLNVCHLKIETIAKNPNISFHDFLQLFEYQKKLGRFVITVKPFRYKSTALLTNTSIYDLELPYFYDLLKILAATFEESERFCLIENYAKIHGLKMDRVNYIKSDNADEIASEILPNRNYLKEMFDLINFKKMTADDFRMGPGVSKIWTIPAEEKLIILNAVVAANYERDAPAIECHSICATNTVARRPILSRIQAQQQQANAKNCCENCD